MREIKFRGKPIGRYVYLGWIDGYYVGGDRPRIFGYDGVCSYDIDPETVGQYIDMHDINGTEIYEGDVVTFSFPDKDYEYEGIVLFRSKTCNFHIFSSGFYATKPVWAVIAFDLIRSIEVKGNIFDDPDLKAHYQEILMKIKEETK